MIESVNRIYGGEWDGKAIMVYGLKTCGYMDVTRAFWKKGVTYYSYNIGLNDPSIQKPKLQGVVQIRAEQASPKGILLSRICKAAITNIIFLNYVLLENQKSIVPIIFCMEKEGVSDYLAIETMTDKKMKKIITASEIRRAYKHCSDPALSDKIKQVALKTFRFVRVEQLYNADQDPYEMTPIPAPWDHPSFETRFALRIGGRQHFGVSKWREQLNELIAEYDLTKIY